MDICDYIDESGETLFLSIFIFRRFIMRIKNPNAKRVAHSKELTASAKRKWTMPCRYAQQQGLMNVVISCLICYNQVGD
jgi:hypothetical protein